MVAFAGRPDCANHTYLHYAYDPVSKRLICPSQGGTGIYNPDIGDFEFSVDQPFNRHIYETCTTSTPKGVFLWGQGGQTWLFDYKERAWKKFPSFGKAPAPQCDGSALCYDSKRDVFWMTTFLGYQKPSGNIWRLDMTSGQVQPMHPANAESIGKAKGFNSEIRESVYVPSVELVLYNNFVVGQEVAYDPNKNRWIVLANVKKILDRQGSVSDTLNWDPKRGLIWNLNGLQRNLCAQNRSRGAGHLRNSVNCICRHLMPMYGFERTRLASICLDFFCLCQTNYRPFQTIWNMFQTSWKA
jgi:hypothetical protein